MSSSRDYSVGIQSGTVFARQLCILGTNASPLRTACTHFEATEAVVVYLQDHGYWEPQSPHKSIYTMASLGEELLNIVNRLQDLVFNTIGNDSLDLPQIVGCPPAEALCGGGNNSQPCRTLCYNAL